MKIGDKFWIFDQNRRKYDGQRNMIYREHFVEIEITGETSRSWVFGKGYSEFKVPKKHPFSTGKIYSDEMKDDKIWLNSKKYKIIRRLEQIRDADVFRKIESLIGVTN